MNNQNIELSRKIAEKQAQAAKLRAELDRSLLIQSIWPNAFDSGTVTFGGKKTMLPYPSRDIGFISAYFRANNGDIYRLSAIELRVFKPDSVIHPNYQEREQ